MDIRRSPAREPQRPQANHEMLTLHEAQGKLRSHYTRGVLGVNVTESYNILEPLTSIYTLMSYMQVVYNNKLTVDTRNMTKGSSED